MQVMWLSFFVNRLPGSTLYRVRISTVRAESHTPRVGGAFPEQAATPFLFSVWHWQPDDSHPMHLRPHSQHQARQRRTGTKLSSSRASTQPKPAPTPATAQKRILVVNEVEARNWGAR